MTQFELVTADTAGKWRQALSKLFNQVTVGGSARDGVLSPGHGLGVNQTSTASASVDIGAGEAIVQDTILGGAYILVNDTTLTLDVLTTNPMGGTPRNDIVVFDRATLSGGTGGLRVIVGDPNAVPTDPTVPTTAIPLARLRHAASATTVPTAKIDDLRVFTTARGGIIPVASATDLPTGHVGSAVYRYDLNAFGICNSAGTWRYFGNVSDAKAGKRRHWGAYAVTTSSGAATITHAAGFTPTAVQLTTGVPGLIVSVTSISATQVVIAARSHDGTQYNNSFTVYADLGE